MRGGRALALPLPLLVLVVLVALIGRPAATRAQSYDSLGALEKEAADEALRRRGLTVDRSPEGKTIRQLHVVTLEVFSSRDLASPMVEVPIVGPLLPYANKLHFESREGVIRRELILRVGERYDRTRVEEAVRNLQAQNELSSAVAILPVDSGAPGAVDMLVVTRDVWSLRFNTDFEVQQGVLLYLVTSLAENNLFGYRKQAAFNFNLYQGTVEVGPTYADPNVLGSRWTFGAAARAISGRERGELEGATASAALQHPFYSLSTPWAGGLSVGYGNRIARRFVQGGVAGVTIAPEGLPEQVVPWEYRLRTFGASGSLSRQLGRSVLHRFTLGYSLDVVRPEFPDRFPEDEATRAAFARRIFPRSERLSTPSLGYRCFVPRYRRYRDLGTFDFTETFRLGPDFEATTSYAVPALGSEREAFRISAGAAWGLDLADGFQSVSASVGTNLEGGRSVDQTYALSVYAATPILWRSLRLIMSGVTTWYRHRTRNQYLVAGSDTGLRGYTIGEFFGRIRAIGHVEARSRAVPLFSLRLGGVLFWDAGRAADRWEDLDLRHAVGLGARLLIPQLNSYVLRFDWAFATSDTFDPTSGRALTRAGWPGRFSLGFRQVF
jgi:hypothetical protein